MFIQVLSKNIVAKRESQELHYWVWDTGVLTSTGKRENETIEEDEPIHLVSETGEGFI